MSHFKWRAFAPAVLVGSVGGPTIWAALMMANDLIAGHYWSGAWWFVPMTGLSFGLIGFPFVAIGLFTFGFPIAWLFRRVLRQRWMILIAALWGGFAGELVGGTLIGEHWDWSIGGLNLLFVLYGSVSGIAWFAYYQRAAKAEEC